MENAEKAAQPKGVVTRLAELPPDAHLDTEALSEMLDRCKKTIQRSVRRGELPAPIKFLGKHVWIVGSILEHMKRRQDEAMRQAEDREQRLSDDDLEGKTRQSSDKGEEDLESAQATLVSSPAQDGSN